MEAESQVVEADEANAGSQGRTDAIDAAFIAEPARVLRPTLSSASTFFQPSNSAEMMVYKWISDMGPDVEIDFLNSMRRFASIVPDGAVARWSLFSGSGVATRFYEALQNVLHSHLGIDVVFETCLYSDWNEDKQKHIVEQFKPQFLVGDVKKLKGASSENEARDGTIELLPYCFSLDGGPPCTSRTPLSSRRTANINCIQENREATGVGFGDTLKVVKQHWPQIVNLECVKELVQESCEKEVSDAEWFSQQLRHVGYWAHTDIMDASDFGSFPPRKRLYWSAMLNLVGSQQEIAHFFNRVLVACKCGEVPGLPDLVDMDEDLRTQSSMTTGVPLHSSVGPRDSKTAKTDLSWKHEHMVLFQSNGIPWPFDHSAPPMGKDTFLSDGLLPREVEATVFLHRVFKMPSECQSQFLDVNPTLSRVAKRFLDDETGRPKELVEESDEQPSSPWRPTPPTLVGSMAMIVRYRCAENGIITVRLLEGFELFRMIGWDDSMWRNVTPPTEKGSDYIELLSNMAGNAYTMYHFGPWALASLATFGRFWKNPESDEVVIDVDGGCDEGQPASSDSEPLP